MKTTHLPHYPHPAHVSVLDNGMTAISVQLPSAILRCEIGFASGAAVEKIPGTAHYLEHMLAGGPSRTDIHPAFKALWQKGMYSNALTGQFRTHYLVESLANNAEMMIDALMRQVFSPEFSSKVFNSERGAILEEYWQKKERREFGNWKTTRLIGDAYALNRAALGDPESINAISLSDVVTYYESEYAMNNCVALAIGGIRHEEFLELLSKTMARCDRKKERTRYPSLSVNIDHATYRRKHESAYTELYWTRDLKSNEMICAKLALSLLTAHPLGIFLKELRGERGLAYSIGFGVNRWAMKKLALFGEISERHFPIFHELAMEYLRRLALGDVPQELFEAERANIRIELETAHEVKNRAQIADDLLDDWILDEFTDHDQLAALKAITMEDIRNMAETHFIGQQYGRIDKIPEP